MLPAHLASAYRYLVCVILEDIAHFVVKHNIGNVFNNTENLNPTNDLFELRC
nr:MAG TPA: hypothetical protein [Caudoviricetes sp.]